MSKNKEIKEIICEPLGLKFKPQPYNINFQRNASFVESTNNVLTPIEVKMSDYKDFTKLEHIHTPNEIESIIDNSRDYLFKIALDLEETVLKKVLKSYLKRDATYLDAKNCTRAYRQDIIGVYFLYYGNVLLGKMSRKIECDKIIFEFKGNE